MLAVLLQFFSSGWEVNFSRLSISSGIFAQLTTQRQKNEYGSLYLNSQRFNFVFHSYFLFILFSQHYFCEEFDSVNLDPNRFTFNFIFTTMDHVVKMHSDLFTFDLSALNKIEMCGYMQRIPKINLVDFKGIFKCKTKLY